MPHSAYSTVPAADTTYVPGSAKFSVTLPAASATAPSIAVNFPSAQVPACRPAGEVSPRPIMSSGTSTSVRSKLSPAATVFSFSV